MSNRLRCSNCNAGSEHFAFLIDEDVKFRMSFLKSAFQKPVLRTKKHVVLNKIYALEQSKCLIMVCLECGTHRKTGLDNNPV